MKKTLFVAAIAALALASCGKKVDATKAVADAAAATEQTAATETKGVVTLTDDNTVRPDMKVEKLTILDFNATWCGPCKMLHPVFEAAALKYPNIEFVSIDIDKLPATTQAFGVEAVPTVVFIKPDGTTKKFIGTDDLLPADKFDALVQEYLK